MNRPGLMMYGQIVMSPGRVDTTGSYGFNRRFWIEGSKIYCDGRLQRNVIAYDESEGSVLTISQYPDGSLREPELALGLVSAVPRFVKMPIGGIVAP